MFTVLNQASGKSFQSAGDAPVLDDALAHGLNFPYGCQNGFCGKCKAVVLNGEIDYDGDVPAALTEQDLEANMALLCQCRATSDLYINVDELDDLANIEVRSLPCKVEQINRLNHDVIQIMLKIPGAQSLQYLAGQYLDLEHSDFEPRAFSIANAPVNSNLIELHVRLVEDGQFTNFIFNSLTEKTILRIEGPKGDFFLREESDKPAILIAGGTGFGPIKAIVEHLISIDSQRKIHIYWGVRAEEDIYSSLPSEWANEFETISYTPVLSEANGSWRGEKGYVHEAVIQDFSNLSDYEVYACGPPIMVRAAASGCLERGLSKKHFYSDAFEYAFEENADD
ncbi:MAG TPA: CDP-6-deoxy-delta-3,4-glucoseen reductase [Candidatus Thioglobus sp.]|jgi:CDP-4-dehydro-6-deoxyglucose reductase|nr:CDP-6-deoxy-delta-3,4-glucoseen reductase [Candidatus Thioglobus sp.]HIL21426.1 CDP-6-deoxy-delta-3,4-glucoseen reductase [Candidatus Thioglobus sp.]